MQQKLQRNIALTFRVSEGEREMVRRRQAQTGIQNLRACIRNTDPNGNRRTGTQDDAQSKIVEGV